MLYMCHHLQKSKKHPQKSIRKSNNFFERHQLNNWFTKNPFSKNKKLTKNPQTKSHRDLRGGLLSLSLSLCANSSVWCGSRTRRESQCPQSQPLTTHHHQHALEEPGLRIPPSNGRGDDGDDFFLKNRAPQARPLFLLVSLRLPMSSYSLQSRNPDSASLQTQPSWSGPWRE